MIHLSNEQLNNYAERNLSVKEMLETDTHLASCDVCRNNLASLTHTSLSSLINNFSEAADTKTLHLTYEELSGYVKKNLDAVRREIVESHAENCHRCAKELRDLQAFALTLSEEKKEEIQKSFLQTLLAKIGLSTKESLSFGLPQLAAVMGVIVMFTGAAFLFVLYSSLSYQHPDPNQNRIVQNRTPNPNFNKPTPTPSPKVSPLPDNRNQNVEPTPTPTPLGSQPKVEESVPTIATIILLPSGTRNGSSERRVVSKGTKTVRLVVGVEADNYKNYKAVLKNNSNVILTAENLKLRQAKSGKSFVLNVPSKSLPTNDYLLVVSGVNEEGAIEPVGTYTLRIVRK